MAFGVKMTAYSSGLVLKYLSTVARARSTSSVAADEVGFAECGFPYTAARSRAACACSWDRAGSPAPV